MNKETFAVVCKVYDDGSAKLKVKHKKLPFAIPNLGKVKSEEKDGYTVTSVEGNWHELLETLQGVVAIASSYLRRKK